MAQTVKILHWNFGAGILGKTKALTSCGWRAFESIYYCSRFVFFTLTDFWVIIPADPKR
jgi:hypothetical protein